jgi:CDP-diglyceride synthetase
VTRTRPSSIAILLLAYSIIATKPLYQISRRRWLPFVLILTFSSGMITLFIYASSLLSNEKNTTKKNKKPIVALLALSYASITQPFPTQERIKSFSSQAPLILIATLLIMTIAALTAHSHHPFQTLNSSF